VQDGLLPSDAYSENMQVSTTDEGTSSTLYFVWCYIMLLVVWYQVFRDCQLISPMSIIQWICDKILVMRVCICVILCRSDRYTVSPYWVTFVCMCALREGKEYVFVDYILTAPIV